MGKAEKYWRARLAEWAIPPEILASVEESPWQAPAKAMLRRADRPQPSRSRGLATEALDPQGTVLDVGSGPGGASVPLIGRITELIAVDEDESMLAELAKRGRAAGVPVHTVVGRWPDVAPQVPAADVVLCHHVFYNVPDLAAFATALHEHARRRVVVELSERHPHAAHSPLWKVLHGLDRPDGPTADDAAAVLREAGLDPRVERWRRAPTAIDEPELREMTRRALCLPAQRMAELEAAMRAVRPVPTERPVVTLWWDV